jgi:hypothetical protein
MLMVASSKKGLLRIELIDACGTVLGFTSSFVDRLRQCAQV